MRVLALVAALLAGVVVLAHRSRPLSLEVGSVASKGREEGAAIEGRRGALRTPIEVTRRVAPGSGSEADTDVRLA